MEFYHERQHLQRCLRHTLNNLHQRPVYTCRDLDDLCFQLSPSHPLFNPHRTWGLGNYDVNVMELALKRQGKDLSWYDVRDRAFERLELGTCWGIIVNVKASGALAWLTRGRHWFALRPLSGRWYNLDSHLPQPVALDQQGLGNDVAVRQFLATQVAQHDGKVFLVKETPVAGQQDEQARGEAERKQQEQLEQQGKEAGC